MLRGPTETTLTDRHFPYTTLSRYAWAEEADARTKAISTLLIIAGPMTATAQTAAGNAAATATAAPVAQTASAGYQLGPNDELKISVFGQPDLSTTTRIKEDGTVLLALVGPVSAKGQTTTQLAQDIAAGYASGGYITKPSVSVEAIGRAHV